MSSPLRDPVDENRQLRTRIGSELESLRQRITDLKHLESELSQAELALNAVKDATQRTEPTADRLQWEVVKRLGFFPPALTPALSNPSILESLWEHSLSAYHNSQMPEILREKIAACLARFCANPYSVVTHACTLRSLGVDAEQILDLLQKPFFWTEADMNEIAERLAEAPHPLSSWPAPGSVLEETLVSCAVLLYERPVDNARYRAELRDTLGEANYVQWVALLAYLRASHLWIESHPEIAYDDHKLVRDHFVPLLRSEPLLAEIFRSYHQAHNQDRQRLEAEKALQASEERYRELFENANDIIYTHDFQGNLTSLNRAAERIIGHSRSDALRMKIMDFVAPEYLETARKMIDRQVAGEYPVSYELEIVSRDGQRVALGISTRPIFHEGKAVAVQGIARDITERKRTEAALQQANQNLAAWVNELEQRTREMTLLNEMGDMLRACLTTEEAYSVIVRVAQQIFPVQVGALYVITPSRNLVEAVAVWGDSEIAERVFSPEECWALRRGRIHWVEDSRFGLICKHLHHDSPEGYLCVPMMAQSEALGVLHLTQPENIKMTESKQRLAVTMSEHIAMALSNLRLHETLRSQSIRDPLTGLFNRRFMEEALELEVRRATRNQRPLGVIMIDLDNFKHFNDTFGHEAGDTLLKELGTLLQTNIRGEDIACRYGGEEFTLILPEGNAEVTRSRAEFLREEIKRLDIQHRNQPLGRISASMGVALFPEHGRTGRALLEAADGALYKSKDAGRDRVSVANLALARIV